MSDYVYLKNLNGQQIKPVTDLAAINMTTTNGIGVSTVNGGTIGIIDGYIESAYYTEMADPAVGAANVSSAYVDGGTAVAILGAYTVASAVDTAAPSQQKVPSEKAVVDALNNVVVSGVSYYARTGIDINAGHTVSVANVPQSSVAGLETTLTGINTAVAAKQDAISAGYRMSLDGTTLNQERYFNIESPTSATITLQAGHAYKITATNSSKTLDSEQIPANQFGLEGHAEIFIAGTGLIKTTSNVVLANALEPDAVNNCTVRFHDGLAIISVEDHVAGYIVVSATGSTAGTLPYALGSASQQYVAFDATLNGQTLDMGGATTNGEKHIVGNGYTETIVSGGINCTSKTTFANLGMNGVIVSSGTMTLGDVYIPSGSTVAVSGGTLVIEKVTGNGGMIDLGGTYALFVNGGYADNCVFTGGRCGATTDIGNTFALSSCTISGNTATSNQAGGMYVPASAIAKCKDTIVSGNLNSGGTAFDIMLDGKQATIELTGCTVGYIQLASVDATAIAVFTGNNTLDSCGFRWETNNGSVSLTSGAIVDLTGNSNTTPIVPGGGITFESGGATVKVGDSTASSSYMMDNVTLPAGAKLTNTAEVDLNGSVTNINVGSVSGVTFIGGGQVRVFSNGVMNDVSLNAVSSYIFSGGSVSGVTAGAGCQIFTSEGGTASNTTVNLNGQFTVWRATSPEFATVNYGGKIIVSSGGTLTDITVNSGGSLTVISGGSALDVTSATGALITVNEGGVITYKE